MIDPTLNEDHLCRCPYCGYVIDFQDYGIDGTLQKGLDIECYSCNKKSKVSEVDYDVTFWLIPAEDE